MKQVLRVNVRAQSRADDLITVVNDIKNLLGHDTGMKAHRTRCVPDKTKAPRKCGGPSAVAYLVVRLELDVEFGSDFLRGTGHANVLIGGSR